MTPMTSPRPRGALTSALPVIATVIASFASTGCIEPISAPYVDEEDASVTVIIAGDMGPPEPDDGQDMPVVAPEGCVADSARCGEAGAREVCRAGEGYVSSPCGEGEVCDGDGDCVRACQREGTPCEAVVFEGRDLARASCLGHAVVAHEGKLAVSDPCEREVHIFAVEGAGLRYEHTLMPPTGTADTRFGESLAVTREGGLIVGATGGTYGGLLIRFDGAFEGGDPDVCVYPLFESDDAITTRSVGARVMLREHDGARYLFYSDPDVRIDGSERGAIFFARLGAAPCVYDSPIFFLGGGEPGEAVDFASAFDVAMETIGDATVRFTFYIGAPGAREGQGLVYLDAMAVAFPDRVVERDAETQAYGLDSARSLGERVALSRDGRGLFISAPDSVELLERLGVISIPGMPSMLPPLRLENLGYGGHRVGASLVTAGDGLYITAHAGDLGEEDIVTLLERDGVSWRETRRVQPSTLPTSFPPATRLGEAIIEVGEQLVLTAPDHPGGGAILLLSF